MYPNLLLSALILLIALRIIGGILPSPKIVKGCQIASVLLVSGALIGWLLAGASPVPDWLVPSYRRLVQAVLRLVQ